MQVSNDSTRLDDFNARHQHSQLNNNTQFFFYINEVGI